MQELILEAEEMLEESILFEAFKKQLDDLLSNPAVNTAPYQKTTKTLTPWRLYEISYKNYKHDANPLIMPFEHKGHLWYAINFHYMHPEARVRVMENLVKIHKLNSEGKAQIDHTDLLHMFDELSFCFRSYKTEHIGAVRGISYYDFMTKEISSTGSISGRHRDRMYKRSRRALR